jgi:hypothetical protein
VARIEEGEPHAGRDGGGVAVRHRDQVLEDRPRVALVVERLDAPHVALAAVDQPVDEAGVGGLNHGGVHQHRGAEIARGTGREDVAPEAALHQRGQRARMVDVRVREHDRVDRGRVDAQRAVLFDRFLAPALEQSAVEQHGGVRRAHQMLRAGDGLRGADELDLHGAQRRPVRRSGLPPGAWTHRLPDVPARQLRRGAGWSTRWCAASISCVATRTTSPARSVAARASCSAACCWRRG